MVQLFQNEHVYKHPWQTVTSAFWLKYPNPQYPHVREVDCTQRSFDPSTGTLHSHRLITCASTLPSWSWSLGLPETAVMTEHSIVDPVSKTMVLKSRNVTCSNLMIVEETCTYRPHPENPNWTSYKIEAKISAFAPFLSHRLEQHSLSNISSQAQKGLRVMESLCDMVSQETFDALTYLRNLSQGVQRSRS